MEKVEIEDEVLGNGFLEDMGVKHCKGVQIMFDIFGSVWVAVDIVEEKIELREDLKSRRGLAVSLEIICHNCGESTSTMSSKISNKCYDVNLRLTYGMSYWKRWSCCSNILWALEFASTTCKV
ncbi:hypothetical protein TNCV_1984561 [Trichonephila clavipes]|nr:hypothetical protein TNCV_1984561 [Trichonephila clavipes]